MRRSRPVKIAWILACRVTHLAHIINTHFPDNLASRYEYFIRTCTVTKRPYIWNSDWKIDEVVITKLVLQRLEFLWAAMPPVSHSFRCKIAFTELTRVTRCSYKHKIIVNSSCWVTQLGGYRALFLETFEEYITTNMKPKHSLEIIRKCKIT